MKCTLSKVIVMPKRLSLIFINIYLNEIQRGKILVLKESYILSKVITRVAVMANVIGPTRSCTALSNLGVIRCIFFFENYSATQKLQFS